MWARVEQILAAGAAEGLFAGAALCVRDEAGEIFAAARGQAEVRPRRRPAGLETPWDLASITKALGTTAVCMRLVGDGRLDLDAPVADRLPGAPAGVTAAHCLSHTSGLPAWRRLFVDLPDQASWGTPAVRAQALRLAYTTPVVAAPGEKHTYSDLGMMTLGALLEAIGGDRLDALWQREVGARCGADLRWGWPALLEAGAGPALAAATEDCPVRGRVLVGEVHDLNAAVLGGAAGHAGLFGSVRAAAAAAAWHLRAWLGEAGEGLDPAVVRQFWSYDAVGSHRLGWDSPTPGASSAGRRWPPGGVGHIGFTGGALWIAPRQRIIATFLSNRVHPEVEGGSQPGADGPRTRAFRALRPRLFTAVVEALEGMGRWK